MPEAWDRKGGGGRTEKRGGLSPSGTAPSGVKDPSFERERAIMQRRDHSYGDPRRRGPSHLRQRAEAADRREMEAMMSKMEKEMHALAPKRKH